MSFKDLSLRERLEHIGLGNYYAEDIDEAIARIAQIEAELAFQKDLLSRYHKANCSAPETKSKPTPERLEPCPTCGDDTCDGRHLELR